MDTIFKLYTDKYCVIALQVSGALPTRPSISFAHFSFDEQLMGAIRKSEYTQPTPIQCQVWINFGEKNTVTLGVHSVWNSVTVGILSSSQKLSPYISLPFRQEFNIVISFCYSSLGVLIAGCLLGKGWLYHMFVLQITSYKYDFLR